MERGWTSPQTFLGGHYERTYFDVRVFNPMAPSNRQQSLASIYKKHERIKIRAYEQRVREVGHGSFTPLVMALTVGCGTAANICYKRLASLLAEKLDQPYSNTLSCLRCKLSFALLRSPIQCIRGARSNRGRASSNPSCQLILWWWNQISPPKQSMVNTVFHLASLISFIRFRFV